MRIACFVVLLFVFFVVVVAGTCLRPKVRILAVRGVCRRHHRIRRSESLLGLKGGFFGCFLLWWCKHLSFFGRFVVVGGGVGVS